MLPLRVPQIVIFGMLGCRQIFLVLKGAANPKRWKNTVLDTGILSFKKAKLHEGQLQEGQVTERPSIGRLKNGKTKLLKDSKTLSVDYFNFDLD